MTRLMLGNSVYLGKWTAEILKKKKKCPKSDFKSPELHNRIPTFRIHCFQLMHKIISDGNNLS